MEKSFCEPSGTIFFMGTIWQIISSIQMPHKICKTENSLKKFPPSRISKTSGVYIQSSPQITNTEIRIIKRAKYCFLILDIGLKICNPSLFSCLILSSFLIFYYQCRLPIQYTIRISKCQTKIFKRKNFHLIFSLRKARISSFRSVQSKYT